MKIENNIVVKDLLTAGAHYGHKKELWHPGMSRYIYGIRNGIHIINLELTLKKLYDALDVVHRVATNNGRILFVNTKKQSCDIVKDAALRCGQYYINQRWLGGTLTNWSTISSSVQTLKKYEELLTQKHHNLIKKEKVEILKRKERLEKSIGGIKNMNSLPDIILINDVKKHHIAVREANSLSIPVIGIVDTNSSPHNIHVTIPANDDSRRSVNFFINKFADTIILGTQNAQSK